MAKHKLADVAKEQKLTPHEIIRLLAGEPGAPQNENDFISDDLLVLLKAKQKARRIVRIPRPTPPVEEKTEPVVETIVAPVSISAPPVEIIVEQVVSAPNDKPDTVSVSEPVILQVEESPVKTEPVTVTDKTEVIQEPTISTPVEAPGTDEKPSSTTTETQETKPVPIRPEKRVRNNGPRVIYRPGDPNTTLPPGVTLPTIGTPPPSNGTPTTRPPRPGDRRDGRRDGRRDTPSHGPDRPRREGTTTTPRPGGDRPHTDRSQDRPGTYPSRSGYDGRRTGTGSGTGTGDRPRPSGDRPYTPRTDGRPTTPYRPSGDRPTRPGDRPRPSGDRPYRPGGDGRPGGDRPSRPPHDSGTGTGTRPPRPGIGGGPIRSGGLRGTPPYVPPTKETTTERRRAPKTTKPLTAKEKAKISAKARLEEKLRGDEALTMIRQVDEILGEEEPIIAGEFVEEEEILTTPRRSGKGTGRPRSDSRTRHRIITTTTEHKVKKAVAKTLDVSGPKLLGDFVIDNSLDMDQVKSETAKLVDGPIGVLTLLTTDMQQIIGEILGFDVKIKGFVSKIQSRPPVVAVLGHVDHGKTSLLDAIRHTNVTTREAGGITQHIGASIVNLPKGRITFIDTPGHEAFTAMRARGAQVTDIVILVVAADDGIMPQTIEAINHAKAANVKIIVAINKIDKRDANPERVLQELSKHGLTPEEWGGTTICVKVSATEGTGIDTLMEMILLEAEMLDLHSEYEGNAVASVIESTIDPRRGNLASVLVRSGTLKIGDNFVVGEVSGRVRSLMDDKGKGVKNTTPGLAVELMGSSALPAVGETLFVVSDEKKARILAEMVATERTVTEVIGDSRISLDDFFRQMSEGSAKELNLILKGDAAGTLEAVSASITNQAGIGSKPIIIHKGVGTVSESDVLLAKANKAVIIGFAVSVETRAQNMADMERVEIRTYNIIYDLLADLKSALLGMLEPEIVEVILGRVEIREVFRLPKAVVAGSFVLSGKVLRGSQVRQYREEKVIWTGRIESLRRFKEDVREVAAGYECGVVLEGRNDILEGDILEAFNEEKVLKRL